MTKVNICVVAKIPFNQRTQQTPDGELYRLMLMESKRARAADEQQPITSFLHALIFTPVIRLSTAD